MTVSIVGLGRMGKNIVYHLLDQDVKVVAYNRSREKVDEVVAAGAIGAYSLYEIPQKFIEKPIVIILYIPAGAATDEMLFGASAATAPVEKAGEREVVQSGLVDILPPGSIIIDGGNSFFKDSQRRYGQITAKGLHFLDMGTSGGLEGARNGACLMVGGDEPVYKQVEPLLGKIACADGYSYFGPSGAGHFVKMVHNAVEYGMMGAVAEGFDMVRSSEFSQQSSGSKIDLVKLAKVWAHGSIISGLLMNKARSGLEKDPQLTKIEGAVPRGETEVEMEWLRDNAGPHPVIDRAREQRVETRTTPSFIGKVVSTLRHEFGGHKVEEKK